MLNRYFTSMSKIALAYGAHIDKFIGDAMLMFFGDPETRGAEEDARACVRMAVAMQRQMIELQQEWRGSGFEQPFEMRIGINTGYCNVGNFGSDDRMDYTIIGAEVNLAARIEAAADPGGILISYPTYALVRDIVRAEERGNITAKGIRREVRVYAVLGILDDHDAAPVIRE
jgi:adenylate cyclase